MVLPICSLELNVGICRPYIYMSLPNIGCYLRDSHTLI